MEIYLNMMLCTKLTFLFLYKHNYGLLKRNKGLYEGGGRRDFMKVEEGDVHCKKYNGH